MTAEPPRFQRGSGVACLLAACVLSACAGVSERSIRGREAFYNYDYAASLRELRVEQAREDENYVLSNLWVASAALAGGDTYDGERALLNAVRVMVSDSGKQRGMLSLVSAESLKIFKGEPFEKAMAYFYLGIIYYNRAQKSDDYDNARAAFSQALLMDKQAQEGYREDLRLVYFMLAKTYLRLGDEENAKVSLRKAQERRPGEPYAAFADVDLQALRRANFTVLVEMGRAPQKLRHGPGASLDVFQASAYPEAQVRLELAGTALGQAGRALDLFYEAQHRGSSGKDVVQGVKGVARDAAVVTAVVAKDKWVKLGAGLFALANQSQADVRQWDLLPGEIHVYSGNVPSGLHTLTLDFADRHGMSLPRYRQIWYYLPVEAERETVWLFRSGNNKGGSL